MKPLQDSPKQLGEKDAAPTRDWITLRAPAKVNLSLNIMGRRDDGYHLLDSIMVPISLYDTLKITRLRKQGEIRVTCDHPGIPEGRENLAYKAAHLFLEASRSRWGVSIQLKKRIPIGAGLGGGSSDAAAVLKGLNRLLDLNISERGMMRTAESLGADVPFFIPCRPARVRGTGAKLLVLPGFPTLWLLVVYPGYSIETASIYASVRLTKRSQKATHIASFTRGAIDSSSLINDLESVAMRLHPEIANMKERLFGAGAEAALMTGSGSSVFGLFSSQRSAHSALGSFKTTPKESVFLVHSVDRWAVAKR